jgi:hypothetical protein
MKNTINTPVAFFIFNRPHTTLQVFEAIRQARPARLFIVADGPRSTSYGDAERCRATRAIAERIDWPCAVERNYAEINMGCKQRMTSGIDWVFSRVDEAILLEDDCLPHATFFPFCAELLERYRYNERVMMISGTNYLLNRLKAESSYVFSRYFPIWGWATWKRAWRKYDALMNNWETQKEQGHLDRFCTLKKAKKYVSLMFDALKSNKIDTWDIQWFYSCLFNSGLCIVPRSNLVSNIGVDGTHSSKKTSNHFFPVYPIDSSELIHPDPENADFSYDAILYKKILKISLANHISYITQTLFNKSIKIHKNIRRKIYTRLFGYGTQSNVNKTDYGKNCLLLYLTEPFTDKTIGNNHQNLLQVKIFAKIISNFGYDVDVIRYDDKKVKLSHNYDMVIDLHPGINNVYHKFLSDHCLKAAYITGSNPSFSNKAELERIEQLYKRRGVRLQQRRYVKPFDKDELESFDAIFFIGNSYNFNTYADFSFKKAFFIKNTGYSYLKNRSFSNKSAGNYLFLNSTGQVHKGLDLLLEIFSKNKRLNLYVCSLFKEETDFCDLYNNELFHSNNIFPIGFTDINSDKFHEITSLCSFIIMPSCSEGISGSVLTAMSAGLIPIVSRECGFEEDEVFHLKNCSLESISQAVDMFSNKPADWIKAESEKAMRLIETRYSEKNFIDSITNALAGILIK